MILAGVPYHKSGQDILGQSLLDNAPPVVFMIINDNIL